MMPVLTLASDLEDAIPIIAMGGGIVIAIVGMISTTIRKSLATKAHEESRREIAAYVAEGSMTPDDAYKLLSAGTHKGCDKK